MFLDALLDALKDTAIVLPILYLAYLLVSYFSHSQNHKYSRLLHRTKKAGALFGAFLGCVPQCGFSSVISSLYSRRIVSLGTLMAVFIATSDEAVPIMIANPQFIPKLLLLLAVKLVLAIIIGYAIDGTIYLFKRKKQKPEEEVVRPHQHEHGHNCTKNIFLDALKHTAIIVAYICVITLAINLIEAYCGGLEPLKVLFTDNVYIQVLVAALVGLIPNCAASVFIVELYMAGVIGFAGLVAGLCAGAGVGLIVLFTANFKRVRENLGITVLLYVLAVICGFITSLLPI